MRARSGEGERRHRQLVLAPQLQRRPAGHQHLEPGQAASRSDDQRRCREHLLEVVEHEQQASSRADTPSRLSRTGRPPTSRITKASGRWPRRPGPGSLIGARADEEDPILEAVETSRPRPEDPGGSCRRRLGPVRVSSPTSSRSRSCSGERQLVLAPDQRVAEDRQVVPGGLAAPTDAHMTSRRIHRATDDQHISLSRWWRPASARSARGPGTATWRTAWS